MNPKTLETDPNQYRNIEYAANSAAAAAASFLAAKKRFESAKESLAWETDNLHKAEQELLALVTIKGDEDDFVL